MNDKDEINWTELVGNGGIAYHAGIAECPHEDDETAWYWWLGWDWANEVTADRAAMGHTGVTDVLIADAW